MSISQRDIMKVILDLRVIAGLFVLGSLLAIGGMIPWWFWGIVALLGVIYIVNPYDLLPEAVLGLGGIGDDLLVFGLTGLSILFAIVQPFAGSYMYFLGLAFLAVSTVLLVAFVKLVDKGVISLGR